MLIYCERKILLIDKLSIHIYNPFLYAPILIYPMYGDTHIWLVLIWSPHIHCGTKVAWDRFEISVQLLLLLQEHVQNFFPNSDMRLNGKTRTQGFNEINKLLVLRYVKWILMHDYSQVKLPQTCFFIIPIGLHSSDVRFTIFFPFELHLTLHTMLCVVLRCVQHPVVP